jgi:CheY-like chemotaxis protein
MTGIELAKRIKGMGHPYQDIPIIMLTAMSSQRYKDKAKGLASEYMIKPVNYEKLLEKLEAYS